MESIPLDDEGLRIDLLEEKLKSLKEQGKTPKFIYVVPTFQNPAGLTMSEIRRKKLVDLAHEYDILVLEDDPYSRLRYEGTPVKPIKAFDDENRVIFMGTFSKLISPGLRVAWILAPKDLARKLVIAKQSADLCSTTFSQYIAYEFLHRGHLETHLQKIISIYKPKRDVLLKALDEHFPKEAKWTRSEGGMFSWATFPEKVDTVEMFPKAVEKKVAYVVGSAFYPDKSGRNTMRLNFSFPSQEDIKEGVKRLGETIDEEMKS
jgi:2-aminoadipate transaminase